MRALPFDALKLPPLGYAAHLRLWVEDATGAQVNLCDLEGRDWVEGVSWDEGIDEPVAQLTVRLKREVYGLSLAPLLAGSKLNDQDGPLLAQSRPVKLEWAVTPSGGSPAVWTSGFEGTIDEIDWAADPLQFTARDLGGVLQDAFIEDERAYGLKTILARTALPNVTQIETEDAPDEGDVIVLDAEGENPETRLVTAVQGPSGAGTFTLTLDSPTGYTHASDAVVETRRDVETVMQQLLDDNGMGAVDLYVPAAPGWKVGPYKQDSRPLLDALAELAAQIGWDVRYRWHEGTAQWRLTFSEPERDASSYLHTFGPDDYFDVSTLKTDRKGIRNVVRVYWGAGDSKEYVEAEDAASLARYGRRWMQLTPGASKLISSEADAQRLAEAALADLAEPQAEQELELPFFPWAELGDVFRFLPNGVHYDSEQVWAVVGVSHDLGERQRTRLTVRGKPAAMYRGWLRRETRPGVGPGARVPTAPTGLHLETGVERQDGSVWAFVRAAWQPVTGFAIDHYEVQYRRVPQVGRFTPFGKTGDGRVFIKDASGKFVRVKGE